MLLKTQLFEKKAFLPVKKDNGQVFLVLSNMTNLSNQFIRLARLSDEHSARHKIMFKCLGGRKAAFQKNGCLLDDKNLACVVSFYRARRTSSINLWGCKRTCSDHCASCKTICLTPTRTLKTQISERRLPSR